MVLSVAKLFSIVFLAWGVFSCSVENDVIPLSDISKNLPKLKALEVAPGTNQVGLTFEEDVDEDIQNLASFEVRVKKAGTAAFVEETSSGDIVSIEVVRISVEGNKVILILAVQLEEGDQVYVTIKNLAGTSLDEEKILEAVEVTVTKEKPEGKEDEGVNEYSLLEESEADEVLKQKLALVDTSFVKYRDRPLWYALNYTNYKQKIDEALANGANINAVWIDELYKPVGNSFLMYAHSTGGKHGDEVLEEMLEYILSKGANPNVGDKNGNTILHHSAAQDSLERFEFVYNIKGLHQRIKNHAGEDALYADLSLHRGGAGGWRDIDVKEKANFLISEGFLVNRKKPDGNTVFSDYIWKASINYQEDYQKIPEALDFYLDLGAEVDATVLAVAVDIFNFPAITRTVEKFGTGYEWFKKLYDVRSDEITAANFKRMLLKTTDFRVVETLVKDQELDVVSPIDGKYLLLELFKKNKLNLKQYIRTDIKELSWENVYKIIDFYLEKGADITVRDADGNGLLNLVQLDIDVLNKYIAKGADVNAKIVNGGNSLLKKAIGKLDIFKFLINHGANGITGLDLEDEVLHLISYQYHYRYKYLDFFEYYSQELIPTYDLSITTNYVFDNGVPLWHQFIYKSLDDSSSGVYVSNVTFRIVKVLVDGGYNLHFKAWNPKEYPPLIATPLELAAHMYRELKSKGRIEESGEYARVYEYIRTALKAQTGLEYPDLE